MILKNNLSLTLSILILAFAINTKADNRIPVENFFCDSAMTSGTLSPNGNTLQQWFQLQDQNV